MYLYWNFKAPQPMASFSNSDDEEFTFDLLNNQNNNFENRLILENGTQTTSRAFNYYDATLKTVCYFLSLLKLRQMF